MKNAKKVVIKYGGNAMTDEDIRRNVLSQIGRLYKQGYAVVLIHGGGPEINKLLELAKVQSEFIGGQRKTTEETMYYVQLALRGEVNGSLVRILNYMDIPAVGVSGKDGGMVTAIKRYHITAEQNGDSIKNDIGYVGGVDNINAKLIDSLSDSGFLPVIAPIALGTDGHDYNINADIFAGAVAAAIGADMYVSLTNVNGLYENYPDEHSRIEETDANALREFMVKSADGGMLPKLESIIQALENGVQEAHIINGTAEDALLKQISENIISGTKIRSN
ncbi:MAG: acetylglutamate kinase [Balneolia bacterium]|nr:acetylglutamate kinase [Balneolia bacterium]